MRTKKRSSHVNPWLSLSAWRVSAQMPKPSDPWQRLFHTRNEYIDWQEFYLWVRSVLEVENRVPDCLVEILGQALSGIC